MCTRIIECLYFSVHAGAEANIQLSQQCTPYIAPLGYTNGQCEYNPPLNLSLVSFLAAPTQNTYLK